MAKQKHGLVRKYLSSLEEHTEALPPDLEKPKLIPQAVKCG